MSNSECHSLKSQISLLQTEIDTLKLELVSQRDKYQLELNDLQNQIQTLKSNFDLHKNYVMKELVTSRKQNNDLFELMDLEIKGLQKQ